MKKNYALILFLWLMSLGFMELSGQTYFRSLKLSEGLSLVRSTFRDSKGFLWVGNDGLGLIKTDGIASYSYSFNKYDSTSLSSDAVVGIIEDNDNNIWIATRKGLNRYNPAFDNFTRYMANSGKGLYSDIVNRIEIDKEGALWVCTSYGLYLYNKETDKFKPYHVSRDVYAQNKILDIKQDSQGNYWVVNMFDGIYKFEPKSGIFEHYPNPNDKIRSYKSLLIDKDDNFWIANFNYGLLKFDKKKKTFKKYHGNGGGTGTSGLYMLKLFEESDSTILVAVDQGGIDRLNKNTDTFTYINSSNSINNGLLSDGIYSFHKDKEGILWVGTSRGGVYYNNPRQEAFKTYRKYNERNERGTGSLNYNVVSSFYEYSDDIVWVGTDGGGINALEKKTGELEFIMGKPGNSNTLSSDVIRSMQIDADGNVWVAAWGPNILHKYNRTTKSFTRYPINEISSGFDIYGFWGFKIDKKNRIWVSSTNGTVLLYNKNLEKITKFEPDNPLDINPVTIFFEDNNGNLYINSCDGVHKFDEKTLTFTRFIEIPNTISFLQDKNGNFWLGTYQEGLYLCNKDGDLIKNYTEKDGLPDNSALAMLTSDNGDIWFSTNYGLCQYIWAEKKFVSYNEYDGLEGNQFYVQSALKTKEGEMYFGGTKGMISFTPKNIRYDTLQLPCYFTDLHVMGKRVDFKKKNRYLNKHINETKEITLDYSISVFSIAFTSPNFTFPQKIKYAYKLVGFDKEWVFTDYKNKSATYTNLDAGEYTLCIAALPPYVDEISNYKQIKITILPPWWNTWWFKLIVIAFFLLSFAAIYIIRVRKLKNDHRFLEQTVKERTIQLNESNQELMAQKEELEATLEALQDTQMQLVQSEKMASVGILAAGIAHEINNPLNFISGGNTILRDYAKENLNKDHVEEITKITSYIEEGILRTTKIINSLNRFNRKTTSYAETCNLHEILDNCITMLNQSLKNIDLNVHYTCPNYTIQGNEGELHQVFLNILTNSIQAIDENGKIDITTTCEYSVMKITITDNGKGIQPENLKKVTAPFYTTLAPGQGTGLGMSIAYSIVKTHKGRIEYSSEPGEGTTVEVMFHVK